ncbi:MAG: hypothetical protein CVU73_03920 [Deltaproteobacteria bacterium HGW-Deltaproteobacteria-8]|jgi:hypothetical protein|nr:MAG: hypothetical protein CVU73_03920 [Deltaproteobacteria bacterium HGW-Deltaproteobacteria-8]
MNRTSKILAATVAALALTASLALAAETVTTQPDANQTTPWQHMMDTASGYMGQIGFGHMRAEGYGHMGGNGYGHMSQADFESMHQDGYGHMGGNGYGHMGQGYDGHMGSSDRTY